MSSGQGDPDRIEPRVASTTTEDATSFFDAVAPHYDRVYALEGAEHRRRMVALLETAGSATEALVLGVGTGRELPTLLDAGFRTTGIDCSQRMLERCARRGRHGALVHGNFWFSLPFPDASFGVAIALHGTLAHPPDANAPRRLAAELARVVGPGGRVVLELPTRHWFERVAGRDEGGPGVLSLVGEEALFRDRRSGASIAGLVVDPHGWARALEPAFACAMHAISTDEVRIVGARIPS